MTKKSEGKLGKALYLDEDRYEKGNCNEKDKSICFILVFDEKVNADHE